MRTFSGITLQAYLESKGIPGDKIFIADGQYVLPTRRWIQGAFAIEWLKTMRSLGIDKFETDSGDCDDFARGAAWWAGVCHRRTPNHPAGALIFGEFWYARKSGSGHSINFTIEDVNEGKEPFAPNLLFSEPQTREIVTLTQEEIQSCTMCRI